MRILIAGASGLIGSALSQHLAAKGHSVTALSRGNRGNVPTIQWAPEQGRLDPGSLEGFDGVVNLAGENIAAGRWTAKRKEAILTSRVRGTGLLARTLAGLRRPPSVVVSASAVGYYGSRGDDLVDESSSPGSGFLANVCRQWEAATEPTSAAGIRTVLLRIGAVLTPAGGMLPKMLPAFRLGLGGPLASGRQWVSWISLDDLVRVIEGLLTSMPLAGPVNAVSPQPVTNRSLTDALSHQLSRPAFFSVPAFALRIVLGELADELLLASTRVLPRRLMDAGFEFTDRQVDAALKRLLSSRGN